MGSAWQVPPQLQVPVEEICRHLGLRFTTDGGWLNTKGLLVAIHPCMTSIAVACRNEVVVFRLLGTPTASQCTSSSWHPPSQPSLGQHPAGNGQDGQQGSRGGPSSGGEETGSLLGCAVTEESDVTCMTWVTLTPPEGVQSQDPRSSSGGEAMTTSEVHTSAVPDEQDVRHSNRGSAGTSHEPLQLLLVGDAQGFLQMHDSRGRALIRQRLHVGPLRGMRWRTLHMGTCLGSDKCEELTVVGTGSIMQISGDQLVAAWRGCEGLRARGHTKQSAFASVVGWGSGPTPMEQVPPLQCLRWDVPRSLLSHTHAVCMGHQPPDLYALLRGAGSGPQHANMVLLGGGPTSLVSVELRQSAGRSALGAAFGAATSLASDVISMARTAGGTVVGGPAAITRGLKNFVLAPLFSSPVLTGPRGEPPLVTHPDPSSGTSPPQVTPSVLSALHDHPRMATGLFPAPRGCLLAVTDNLGRVMLVDGARMVSLRLWKGYRDAQCGWLEVPVQYCTRKPMTSHSFEHPPHPRTPSPSTSPVPPSSALNPTASDADQQPYLSMHDLPTPSPREPTETDTQGDLESARRGRRKHLETNSVAATPDGTPSKVGMGDAAVQAGRGTGVHAQQQQDGGEEGCVQGTCMVLVLYAPRRQVVELYPVPHGLCLGALQAGPHCQLLPVCKPGQVAGDAMLSCCLLDAERGRIRDIRHELISLRM